MAIAFKRISRKQAIILIATLLIVTATFAFLSSLLTHQYLWVITPVFCGTFIGIIAGLTIKKEKANKINP
ncbi:MAG TPA: hypothetical protein VN721_15010 [Flavipsychrobacter sp.]|nr:hypothetical protein [Flavipsychrobacter sp.]